MNGHQKKELQQRGQGLIEYALLLLLVATGIILILELMGVSVKSLYCQAADSISGGGSCAAQVYCSDNFSSGLSGWNNSSGPWTEQNGQLCTFSTAATFNSCSQNMNANDYTVNLNGADLMQGNGYGVFFRVTNPGPSFNGYSFQYDTGWEGGSFIFRKWVNGVELATPIAVTQDNNFNWYNTSHNVQVVVKGNTFTAYVDGTPVTTVTDSTYATGSVGLRSWDSTQACFHNFTISP
ncbi:MAG: family 16 glycoside hydrolase [Anaerolineales bacterium]